MSDQGYFMFSSQPKKKSDQNCVAYAAYCADEKLFDEVEDRHHKFKEHEIKPVSFIMKPSHAPDWTLNREKLWNEVKKNEKGSNWRTHRDLKLSLPIGFPKDHYLEMTKEFVKENLTDQGMVADVHIHLDHKDNPHVHILCTVRAFNKDGTWADKKKNIPKLDKDGNEIRDEKGWKVYKTVAVTNWDSKEFLENQRSSWSRIHNKYAELNKINKHFDHRSYERQGLDKEATKRLSRRNYELEKQEKEKAKALDVPYKPVTKWGEYNEEVRKENEAIQHKKVMESQQITDIKSIFKKNVQQVDSNLNDIQKQSIKTVLRKAKNVNGQFLSNLNYQVAKEVNNSMVDVNSKWNDYLQREKINIDVQNNFYQLMVKKYKEDPNFVTMYGLPKDRNEFKTIISEKLTNLKSNGKKFNSQFNAFVKEKESASFVYSAQKEIVNRTFEEVYGKEAADKFTSDEKGFAIDSALKDRYIRMDQIKDEYSKSAVSYADIDYMSLAKKYQQSLMITERSIQKMQREIKQNESNPKPDRYIHLFKSEKIRDHYKDLLNQIQPSMVQQIQKDFAENNKMVSQNDLEKMSYEELISYYYNDESMIEKQLNKNFNQERKVVNDTEERIDRDHDFNVEKLNSSQQQDITSGLLGAFGQVQNSQQAKTKETKAKKNRKKRHRDDDLYLE
ncbi:MobA/MobL family protein [Halalkalibacter flavus]|uniref:MobA/MobL family protein n=1 Tax=Halalkalibacter flavus TaxID=3090668 RepID=UPI002FCBDD39